MMIDPTPKTKQKSSSGLENYISINSEIFIFGELANGTFWLLFTSNISKALTRLRYIYMENNIALWLPFRSNTSKALALITIFLE